MMADELPANWQAQDSVASYEVWVAEMRRLHKKLPDKTGADLRVGANIREADARYLAALERSPRAVLLGGDFGPLLKRKRRL